MGEVVLVETALETIANPLLSVDFLHLILTVSLLLPVRLKYNKINNISVVIVVGDVDMLISASILVK